MKEHIYKIQVSNITTDYEFEYTKREFDTIDEASKYVEGCVPRYVEVDIVEIKRETVKSYRNIPTYRW